MHSGKNEHNDSFSEVFAFVLILLVLVMAFVAPFLGMTGNRENKQAKPIVLEEVVVFKNYYEPYIDVESSTGIGWSFSGDLVFIPQSKAVQKPEKYTLTIAVHYDDDSYNKYIERIVNKDFWDSVNIGDRLEI